MKTSNDRPPVCDYEGSDYQSSFWDQGDRRYEDQVEAIALRRLLPPGGKLLLEVGAGAGRNTPRYQGFERIVLLDYSRTQLQQAQERLGRSPRYLYVAADVYRLPFVPGLFDAATMIRTLHHMADAPRALGRCAASCSPAATFILEYASKHNLKAILRYWTAAPGLEPLHPRAGGVHRPELRFPPQDGAFLAGAERLCRRAPAHRLAFPPGRPQALPAAQAAGRHGLARPAGPATGGSSPPASLPAAGRRGRRPWRSQAPSFAARSAGTPRSSRRLRL